ncbi:MAG: hypothetical protein MIL41_25030 [Hyphomicrobiales bacterium]
MNESLRRLQDRFHRAEEEADAAQAEARKASAARLRELLAEPNATKRVAGLRDPLLTAFDRAQLERALAESLPRRKPRAQLALSATLRGLGRSARYHRRGLLLGAVLVLPLAGLTLIAAHRTPPNGLPVRLTGKLIVPWHLPDGSRREEELGPGTDLVWVRHGRTAALRKWFPGLGYAEAIIDDELTRTQLQLR